MRKQRTEYIRKRTESFSIAGLLSTFILLWLALAQGITWADVPTAYDQSVILAEDTSAMITLTATDPEGDDLVYRIVRRASFGGFGADVDENYTVLNNPLTYTPYGWYANYNGEDSFTFVANDGTNDSNVAIVSINITPVDDAPELMWGNLVFSIKPEEASSTKTYKLSTKEVDGDTITYSAEYLPLFASLNSDTGELTLIFTHDDIDIYSDINFSVTDATPAQLSDSYVGTITIREANTYYLDASASDGGDGTSWASAWNSLSQVQNSVTGVKDGDTVIVRNGSYGDFIDGNVFHTDWTTYRADEGHMPIFNKIVLTLWGWPYDKYFHFDGFQILDGVLTSSPRHLVIENCLIEKIGPWTGSIENIEKMAVNIRMGEDIAIKNCEITRTAIGINAYGKDVRLLNNHIHNITHDGIRSVGLWDSLVEGNIIHDLDDGVDDADGFDWNRHCDGIHIFIMGSALPGRPNQNVTFRGNVIYDVESQGVQFNIDSIRHPDIWNNHIVFENNIFGPTRANVFNAADPADTLIFRGNSFIYFPGGREYTSQFRTLLMDNHTLRISDTYTNVQVYNNILVQSGGGGDNVATSDWIFDWNLIQKPISGDAYGRFTILDNSSQFENPEAFDGKLLPTSPAINAGTRLFAPTPIYEFDVWGTQRDNRPDMGAYEVPGQNPAPEEEPQTYPGIKTIFVDDFEDANFYVDSWLEAPYQQGLSWYHPDATSYKYEIIGDNAMPDPNNTVGGPIENGSSWLFSKQGSDWADYTLELRAHAGYLIGGDGIVLLALNSENYYWLDISRFNTLTPTEGGGNLIRFMTDSTGNPTETVLATNSGIATLHAGTEPQREYKINVQHSTEGITFLVDAYNDGSVELTYTDTAPEAIEKFSAGRIGLHRNYPDMYHRLRYDNVKVAVSRFVTVEVFLYGDINGNGEVTAYDAALVARYAVGLETFTDEQRQKADVTGNGAVSAYDAALIAQKAVGLIDRFPVEE